MADYVEYVTAPGDRWDLVADIFYGDPYDYERIISANPGVPIGALIPAGTKLLVPVIYVSNNQSAGLPPWKR